MLSGIRIRLIVIPMSVLLLTAAGCAADGATGKGDGSTDQPECIAGVYECDDTPTETLAPVSPNPSDTTLPTFEHGIAIAEAYRFDGAGLIAVDGFFVDDGETARLCAVLLESLPPQCGGPSLVIPDGAHVLGSALGAPFVEEGSVRWSEGYITLIGIISGNQLTVSEHSG
jgi:hypothetical protein